MFESDSTGTNTLLPTVDSRSNPLSTRLRNLLDSMPAVDSSIEDLGMVASSVEEYMIDSGLADEYQVAKAYSDHYLLPLFDPGPSDPLPVHPDAGRLLPESFCSRNMLAPLAFDESSIEVAIFFADSLHLADQIRGFAGRQMRPLFATKSVIERLLDCFYRSDTRQATDAIQIKPTNPSSNETTTDVVQPKPAKLEGQQPMKYVRSILREFVRQRAEHLSVQHDELDCRIQMLVDGRVCLLPTPPMASSMVVSCIKTLANMDAKLSGCPQKGFIKIVWKPEKLSLRVHSEPTIFGENIEITPTNRLPK